MSEARVQAVFHMKTIKTNAVPLCFVVVPERGAKALYLQYDAFKQKMPELLFEYFEKRLNIHRLSDDSPHTPAHTPCHTPEHRRPKDNRDREKDTREREDASAQDHRQRVSREQVGKNSKERESRPVRSCRRKDGYNRRDDFEMREEPPHPPLPHPLSFHHALALPPPEDSPDVEAASSSSSSGMSEEEEFKRLSFRKILDYDQVIEDNKILNLACPAVIAGCKGKSERTINPGSFYPPLPPLHPLKEPDREFSSEGFKDSEESEFLLDDKGGKERRRRERHQQREQERLTRRKKSRKIKKKKKPTHNSHTK